MLRFTPYPKWLYSGYYVKRDTCKLCGIRIKYEGYCRFTADTAKKSMWLRQGDIVFVSP